ncbi:Nucleoside-diphosphate-sugar epimerases [Richelia intracellularis]|nr:Nucleoside-diphosphate-sugar epimerases [Richelia intracellularis]
MNIAIIGCGYVGYAVAQHWQNKMSLMVTATTTTPERIPELQAISQKVIVVRGNNTEGLKSLLKDQDVVLLSIGRKRNVSYKETYLKTAETLIPVLQQNSTLKQLIYLSSFSVYGYQNDNLVDEETQPNPISDNSKVLRQTEELFLSASNEKLKVCIFRLGGIYGAGRRELVKIVSRYIAGKTLPGNGQQATNWIHIDDIVGGIEFARQNRLQGVYNLVDDANLTQRQLIEEVCKKHNLPPVTWDSSQSRKRDCNAKVTNQKIKDAGYKFLHPNMTF